MAFDSVNPNHMVTTGNTTVKTTLEAYRMSMELMKLLVGLIPEPNITNTMKKDMEEGNVIVDLFDKKHADAIRDELNKAGMKEGKDFLLTNYYRVDGKEYTAVFYNISDKDKVHGAVSSFDENHLCNRECSQAYANLKCMGMNQDGTIDIEKFDKFCKSKGANFDFSKPLAKQDVEFAKSLLNNEYNHLSAQQQDIIAKKMVAYGAVDLFLANSSPGLVDEKTLKSWATIKDGKTEIMSLQKVPFEQVKALEKRAEQYGTVMSVTGPQNGGYTVSFPAEDQKQMERIYAEANYDLHGKAGDLYKQQIRFASEYKSEVLNSITSRTYPDNEKLKEGSLLVGTKVEPMLDKNGQPIIDPKTNNPVMGRQTLEVAKDRMFLNEAGKKANMSAQTTLKDSDRTNDFIKGAFSDSNPVLLNPEDAKRYKSATTEKERLKILNEAQQKGEHGLRAKPMLTKEDCEIIKKHEQMRELVEKKLQEEYPTGDKMAAYINSISPLEMYMNDQLINSETSQNAREYYRGGENFVNRADLESGNFADAISDEDQRFIDEAVADLHDKQVAFDEMDDVETCTAQFMSTLGFEDMMAAHGQHVDTSLDMGMDGLHEENAGDVLEGMEASGLS